jgi:hypothetical protein
VRRQKDEVEPVIDLINAIFHGDARHMLSLRSNGMEYSDCFGVVIGVEALAQDKIVIWRPHSALITHWGGTSCGASPAVTDFWRMSSRFAAWTNTLDCPNLPHFQRRSFVNPRGLWQYFD